MNDNVKGFYQEKTILVTGGAGFIGSHLCEELMKWTNVTSLDNYITGSRLNHHPGVEYLEGSCADIFEILGERRFDIIFHFGEYSRVEQSLIEYTKSLKNIRDGFPTILDYVHRTGSKLVYSGSSTKFCDDGAATYLSPYTLSKAQNTELLASFSKWYGLDHAIVYFYNVYGGREISSGNYATVIAKFLALIDQGETKLPITSPGTQRRNFTHISDVIDALLLVGAYGAGDNYGIGNDDSFSILEVCQMLQCEAHMQVANKANRLSGPVISEKTKNLGWTAKKNLKDYLSKYVQSVK